MGAEEKKLLSDAETSSPQGRQTGFRLHYFPDIPVDYPADDRRCSALGVNFERAHYESTDSTCTNLTSEHVAGEVFNGKHPVSVAKSYGQAYQQGFLDGEKKGMIDGEKAGFELGGKKIEPLLSAVEDALLQLGSIREETCSRIEKEVVKLAMAIAEKVICREITIDREVVVCIAKEALAKIKEPDKIVIKMNPDDLQSINETKHQSSKFMNNMDNVALQAEEGIESGGCIIETDSGEIDARIEKQLQAIEESFQTMMEKTGAGT